MIQIDNTLVSQDLLEVKFVCDLAACKGACCVAGDAGAPLTENEATLLNELYPKIAPFLREEGKKAIEEQGCSVADPFDNERICTPLVDDKECAYTLFDKNGVAKCGIEIAYRAGVVDFIKPISCHLYPVRIQEYEEFDAVNYDKWDVCAPACACGEDLKVPVYKFLKEPLIRKYGADWYEQLCQAHQYVLTNKND